MIIYVIDMLNKLTDPATMFITRLCRS